MKYWIYIVIVSFSLGLFPTNAQDKIRLMANDTITKQKIDPLRPAKAAFYSALLPGAGQAYNKSYWKIPIVYAAIGTGAYAYFWNQKRYDSFRTEYIKRSAKDPDLNPEYARLTDDKLIQGQQFYQRNRDLSLLITVALYALNIIDANVDAHLQQFNVNDGLTIRPEIQTNDFNAQQNIGLALNFKF
ncbi:DUF5683 domain-containing protein [Flavobacterium oreochromis]|uniref:DUF5683 domain-containing protein n=2 Tax=Flavobacterium TaxID=237 RepID=A0A246GC69_9FLAO|nr:DUF5683 domain-containing protein [Flavobacterium oreochromis]OWP77905.1 hypothetical protein BWG23_03780 [Flavobacterium oreochromis]OWP78623.1 hypothetical protein BWK62_04705 [Flavobacterium oreochromis]POR30604.1 hypothetical protein BWK58_01050 [Flavobacterium columnare]QYS85624.1 hypothetical protein JJC03_10465 [Flavobacterium oreochromis]